MIHSLTIKNLAIIEKVHLLFDQGFSVLTGETGAGKSIIIESIKLLLGEKGTSDVIRTGESETSIEAIFHNPGQEKSPLYVQRTIPLSGPGKGYINGTLVPIKKLREVQGQVLDLYGQNDHVFLRQVENQLDYLDAFAQTMELRSQLAQSAHSLRHLITEKQDLQNKERERKQQLDFLAYQIKEIEDVHLQVEEEEEIGQERSILKNREKISLAIEEALDLAYSQEDSILPLLTKLQKNAHILTDFYADLKPASDAIQEFFITLKDFSDYLIRLKTDPDNSSERLESLEQRLSLIENLKRKYGKTIAEILDYLKKAKQDFKDLETSQEKLAEIDERIKETFKDFKDKASILSGNRLQSAKKLEEQIEREIHLLGMSKARFQINITSIPPLLDQPSTIRESGVEEVEYFLSSNPGEDPKPLKKIASGGELSRLMLAIKSLGKDHEPHRTLIFDEIDSGIGGKTAEFVAKKLSSLAQKNQVICITHLPQIASFATHHYKIEKKVIQNRTYTTVKKLSYEERIKEVAHLLAGSHLTEVALQNAKEMLDRNRTA